MNVQIDRHDRAQMYDLLAAANGLRDLYHSLCDCNTLEANDMSLIQILPNVKAALAKANPALVSLGMPQVEVDILK